MRKMQADRPRDLTRTTFQLLALGVLIASTFWILRPFLAALTWATMIAVATWPLLLRAQAWLGGRRSLAVALMTITLLLILVVPLYFGVAAIADNTEEIVRWSKSLATFAVPQAPAWLEGLPLIGRKLTVVCSSSQPPHRRTLRRALLPMPRIRPLVRESDGQHWDVAGPVPAHGHHCGDSVRQRRIRSPRSGPFCAASGRGARRKRGASRRAGDSRRRAGCRGHRHSPVWPGGNWASDAGVPFATILTALMFILAVAQIGAGPVLIGAVIWVYTKSGAVWGTSFLVWAVFCVTFDNFLRPMLIKRNADLPSLLIFTGVVGGLIAFGVIGLFIGPVVLAVAYTLLVAWVSEG
jgi:predicted PurR-regulated permease PerM